LLAISLMCAVRCTIREDSYCRVHNCAVVQCSAVHGLHMSMTKMKGLMFVETSFVHRRCVLVIGQDACQMMIGCVTLSAFSFLLFLLGVPSIFTGRRCRGGRTPAACTGGPSFRSGPQIQHRELLPWFSSVSARKCWSSMSNASIQIPSISFLGNHPTLRQCVVWSNDDVIK
jgi:hypothetical protein